MLFFVKQVHTPDHPPVARGQGADALFDPNADGVTVHFGVSDAPRHTFYFLLEADDLDPIRDFLDKGLADCVTEINPVARLAALHQQAPVRAFFLEREQAFLRYVDLPGEEPSCVFIHGALDSSIAGMAMTAAQPRLAARRRILVDLLGYGLSDRPKDDTYSLRRHAETICELLDSLALEGCQLVGHSMGGTIAVMVASERPDLVRDLVLAEAGFPEGPQGFASFADGKTEDEYVAWFTGFITERLEDAQHENNVLRIHIGMAQAAAPWAVYRTSQSLNAGDLQPTLRQRFLSASMSKAYFVGERSELDEWDHALRADLEAAGGDWVVVPDAEHQMNFDNPGGFAEAIADRI